MILGFLPFHSVKAITCTSDKSGVASSGTVFIAQREKTAKKIAEKRHKFMKDYLVQFFKEWDGKI